jgi:hypothetical protein
LRTAGAIDPSRRRCLTPSAFKIDTCDAQI